MKSLILLLSLLVAGCTPGRVVLGDERADVYLPLLEGSRVALLSNHSGIVGDRAEGLLLGAGRLEDVAADAAMTLDEAVLVPFGTAADSTRPLVYGPHILDVLLAQGVDVTAIFSPEHGFRGSADPGEKVSNSVDAKTGVPILSLYSASGQRPSDEDMAKFDVLVVDIQDVGLRYYTYYITMFRLMEACAVHGKRVVVLDRPNPNGFYVDGPLLDMRFKSGVGSLPIAMVHGMTLGELARMIVGEGWLSCGASSLDLQVVPCLNYTHSTKYSLLMPPSPNLKDMKSVYLYSSTCFFEGSVVTAGRGTPWPFEVYGHPQMSGDFEFVPHSIPGAVNPRYRDCLCRGIDLRVVPLDSIWTDGATLRYLIDAYERLSVASSASSAATSATSTTSTATYASSVSATSATTVGGDGFFLSNGHFEKLVGQAYVRDMILSGASAEQIEALWIDDISAFQTLREPYLLYPTR